MGVPAESSPWREFYISREAVYDHALQVLTECMEQEMMTTVDPLTFQEEYRF